MQIKLPAAWKERFYITVSSLDVKRNSFITTHFVETGVQERHIQMDKKTYKTDRHGQTDRQRDKQKDRQTDTDRQTERQTKRQTDRHGQTGRDKQKDRHGQTDR